MNIYIGNLALDMTEEELRQQFTAFGQVTSVTIMSEKYSGSDKPRVYAFIEMASKAEGDNAISSLNGKELNGRVIDVVGALPMSEKKETGCRGRRKANCFALRSLPG